MIKIIKPEIVKLRSNEKVEDYYKKENSDLLKKKVVFT